MKEQTILLSVLSCGKDSMNRYKEKKRNLIILVAFAAIMSLVLAVSFFDNKTLEVASAAESSSTEVLVKEELGSDLQPNATSSDIVNPDVVDETISDDSDAPDDQEIAASATENSVAAVAGPTYTVTKFDTVYTLYASDTVNVRAGAGTEYDKIGRVNWGAAVEITGVTDNGWFEVLYNGVTAFIRGDYIVSEMPGIPFLFVGDSRTVQMQMAVGSTDKAYIAKIGEGYSYFRDVAIPAIAQNAGQGTTMIINFGVNDLANAKKYANLVNANIDAWINAGITVYYSAVTPVGSNASVSNAQIEAFNTTLKDNLDPRVNWIDSYAYLSQTGFSSSDGLHYNKDTYKNLYAYYMSVINQQ